MHTSANVRLTSVAIRNRIRIRIRDPDRHENLIFYSLAHCQRSLKISCRQTDRQTNNGENITSLAEVINAKLRT